MKFLLALLVLIGFSQSVRAEVGESDALKGPAREQVLRLAIVNSYGEEASREYFSRALETIRKAILPTRLEVRTHDQDTFLAAAHRHEFDVSIASSGLTSWMIEHTGGLPAVTMTKSCASDPNYTTAGTIVTRVDRADIQSLHDLKDQTIAIMSRSAFAGWQLPSAEMMNAGIDVDQLTKRLIVTGESMTKVVKMVESGEADVGFLASCLMEDMAAKGQIDFSKFKVINEKTGENDCCRRSTDMYPGWIVTLKETVSAEQAKAITLSLLSLPESANGQSWTVLADYSRVYDLFKQLNLPIHDVHDFVWFLQYYRNYFLAALVGIVALIGNFILMLALVRFRTRQVKEALQEKYRAQALANEAESRIETLQKISAVGMISSMFAHELNQPLTVITNYAGSLRRRLKRGALNDEMLAEALEEIENSGQMAAEVVERVRSYVKSRTRKCVDMDLTGLVREVVERHIKHASTAFKCKLSLQPDVWVKGDPVELELVILNLLKNAQAAVMSIEKPQVDVVVYQETHYAYLVIRDNGQRLSDEAFARVGAVGHTTKANGLGLGINIVKTLLEVHGGSLVFKRMPDRQNGIEAVVKLPRVNRAKE